MKKEILIFMFLNLVLMAIVLYGFVLEKVHLVIPSLMILVMLLIVGFIFSSYILERKYELDENVLHLTREILHELSIPISTIQANTLLLNRQHKEDEKSIKRLGRITDASVRLERLYEELLYSIKKEIHTVERQEVNLKSLIQERVEIMKLLNRNSFSLELEEKVVYIDKIGFEKMLDNLLSNAMKYSPKTALIDIKLEDDVLSIEDHGIGMDEVILERVFNRYYQKKNHNKGEGIGLALVKAYCHDEKIEISIDSKKEEGTKVCLNLKRCIVS